MKTKKSKKAQASPEKASHTPETIPDPAALVEAAQNEPRIIAARDYITTINILRDQKSFSFREIAEWFNQRGVPLDNNEIYRAYMSDIRPEEKEALYQTNQLPNPED